MFLSVLYMIELNNLFKCVMVLLWILGKLWSVRVWVSFLLIYMIKEFVFFVWFDKSSCILCWVDVVNNLVWILCWFMINCKIVIGLLWCKLKLGL